MAGHNEFGIRGEEVAVAHLIGKGYSIVERNWRCGHKEVDIIAMKASELVFVEVKTRKDEEVSMAIRIGRWVLSYAPACRWARRR